MFAKIIFVVQLRKLKLNPEKYKKMHRMCHLKKQTKNNNYKKKKKKKKNEIKKN